MVAWGLGVVTWAIFLQMLNAICSELRPCTENYHVIVFYAKYDSVNNSYQWRSPLFVVGVEKHTAYCDAMHLMGKS